MALSDHTTTRSAGVTRELRIGGRSYRFFSLAAAAERHPGLARLPRVLKILAEGTLRNAPEQIGAYEDWLAGAVPEVDFWPARVVVHDSTCVPAFVDFAAMRDAAAGFGLDPAAINPRIPVEVVIDHSVSVDRAGTPDALESNMVVEIARNRERYELIRWAERSLSNVTVTPPGFGIVHQVNLERLARVVRVEPAAGPDDLPLLLPDTLVGADSHTPMINGLGVLGWGVGGIEAQMAALAKPLPMLLPAVLGIRVVGALRPGVTAADLVYTLVDVLRRRGVIDHMLEFFGPGLGRLGVTDRATLANMVPEYGATTGYFPVDRQTLAYLSLTGRSEAQVAIVEAYARAQGLWAEPDDAPLAYTDVIDFDLATVETSLAGPRNPAERVTLSSVPASVTSAIARLRNDGAPEVGRRANAPEDGAVLIAAITSCTTTANPRLMIGAGLLAKKARARGLRVPWWVKTSLSPGSRPTARYLRESGLQDDLDALGFNVTGFGCMTCCGNSGDLGPGVTEALERDGFVGTAVLSGNRNFEGRIHPQVRAAYLASPALVVAYAIAGTTLRSLADEPVGTGADGAPVHLAEIWPGDDEIDAALAPVFRPAAFAAADRDNASSFARWEALSQGDDGILFPWREDSDYLRRPPYLDGMALQPPAPSDIRGARLLLMVGDRLSTDHISPSGAIAPDGVTGRYLISRGIERRDFNQYAARRGDHEVMVRGGFSNAGIVNELLADTGTTGGFARLQPDGTMVPLYEAAMAYRTREVPLIVIAGKEYGTGSSRDWAAKATALLGVRAVIAEGFERIHRANLISLGVLPLEFTERMTRHALAITGEETFDILGLAGDLRPGSEVALRIHRREGTSRDVPLLVRIDTPSGVAAFRHGGVLRQTIRELGASRRPHSTS